MLVGLIIYILMLNIMLYILVKTVAHPLCPPLLRRSGGVSLERGGLSPLSRNYLPLPAEPVS